MLRLNAPLNVFFFIAIFYSFAPHAQEKNWVITNIAGNGTTTVSTGVNALETGLQPPGPIDIDGEGNIYFACPSFLVASDAGIFKIEHASNEITEVLSGITYITGIAVSEDDKIYFSRGGLGVGPDPSQEYIYYLDLTTGGVDTLAGTGDDGIPASGAHARSTPIGNAGGIKIDPTGKYLYYTATKGNKNFIQKIDLESKITTRVAGISGAPLVEDVADGTDALLASLDLTLGLAWDSEGSLYFATATNRIKKIKLDNTIWHVAGTGVEGFDGDGGPASDAQLDISENGFVITSSDYLFLTENGNLNIRRIFLSLTDGNAVIERFCGTGLEEGEGVNPEGDLANGVYKLALETNIDPVDILLDGDDLVFTDLGNGSGRIRRATFCVYPEIISTLIDPITICKGDSVKLSFNGSLNDAELWKWHKDGCSEGESLSNGTALNIIAIGNESYYISGSGGCLAEISCVEIEVKVECKEYYNTFSPNDDGKNDFFEIPVLTNFPNNTVTIYNRWGDILETIDNYDNTTNNWNGTNGNDDPVDSGTYYFTVVSSGELITSGWVELMR